MVLGRRIDGWILGEGWKDRFQEMSGWMVVGVLNRLLFSQYLAYKNCLQYNISSYIFSLSLFPTHGEPYQHPQLPEPASPAVLLWTLLPYVQDPTWGRRHDEVTVISIFVINSCFTVLNMASVIRQLSKKLFVGETNIKPVGTRSRRLCLPVSRFRKLRLLR